MIDRFRPGVFSNRRVSGTANRGLEALGGERGERISGTDSNLKVGDILRAKELREAYVDTMQILATQKQPAVLAYWTLIGPVLRNASLRPTAVRLMCWLILSANREGEVPRSYAQMGEAVGVKERAIYEALAQLEERGLIARLQFKPKGPAHVHIRVATLVEAAKDMPDFGRV